MHLNATVQESLTTSLLQNCLYWPYYLWFCPGKIYLVRFLVNALGRGNFSEKDSEQFPVNFGALTAPHLRSVIIIRKLLSGILV